MDYPVATNNWRRVTFAGIARIVGAVIVWAFRADFASSHPGSKQERLSPLSVKEVQNKSDAER